ncbi:unnamed protein product [Rhizophagus irregularis]|nr:unnamed protein product [Rhizophagus irregularis]
MPFDLKLDKELKDDAEIPGTAGCVLARELIYNIPNINILVLEAGPPNTQVNDIMRSPCGFPSVHRTSETDWGYSTEDQKMPSIVDPTKEVLNKGFPYARAKVIGGCSTVNAMVYIRGQKADYDLWAAQGHEYKIWDYEHCLEAFKAVENNSRKSPDEEFKKYHGFNGLLNVQDSSNDNYDILKDIYKIANNLGIPFNNDFNGVRQNGLGEHQCTMKDGKRFSLADGSPHGLSDDAAKFVAVNGEVIICGGAINSAQILMLSGIGPKNNLEENNIKVRKELPVGRNLLEHPACCVTAKVSVPNSNINGKVPSQKHFLDERPNIQFYANTIPLGPPLIEPGKLKFLLCYLFLIFHQVLKLSREILKQPPLSTVWGVKEVGFDIDKEMSDEDWNNIFVKCLWNQNLRVVDASIFPTIPAGNLNAPTAMVAWKASRLIKEDYKNKV